MHLIPLSIKRGERIETVHSALFNVIFLTRAVAGVTSRQIEMAIQKDRERVEAAVLEVAQRAAGHKKGILQRIRKSGDPDEAKVLSAAISALGALGTARSEPFLVKMAKGKIPHAVAAAKALDALRTRSAAVQPQG